MTNVSVNGVDKDIALNFFTTSLLNKVFVILLLYFKSCKSYDRMV